MLGNGRLEAKCADGSVKLCHIRGKFRKRVWINTDDVILLGLRAFEDEKADVIGKYTLDEARTLQAYEELPKSWIIGGGASQEADDGADVKFGAGTSSEEDDDDIVEESNIEAALEAL